MKFMFAPCFRLLGIFASLISVSYAGVLYVATNGSDSASGSQTAPLATLGKALTLVKAGDTISIGPGTFSGNVNTSVAGTNANPITIQGSGVGVTIYTGSLVIDSDYYTIQRITFMGSSVTFSGATGCILESCEAYRGLNNFKVEGGSSCIVRNNLFQYPGANSMGNVSGNGHLIEGNTFRNNNGFDVHRTNGAINCIWRGNIYDGIGTPNNNITSSSSSNSVGLGRKTFSVASGMAYTTNDFMRIEVATDATIYLRAWVVSYSGTTLVVDVGSTMGSGTYSSWNLHTEAEGNHADILQSFSGDNYGCIFEGNRVNNSTSQLGMFEANPDTNTGSIRDWTFRNNVFYNSRTQTNIYAPGFRFYNNTVYNTPDTIGFRGATATKGNGVPVLVYNNVFCRVGSTEGGGPYMGATADYNLITDYADDSAKTGYAEAHGINGGYTPYQIFVDPDHGDLRLKTGSPALGAGGNLNTLLGLTTLAGATTPSWDIGATTNSLALLAGLPAPGNVRVGLSLQ